MNRQMVALSSRGSSLGLAVLAAAAYPNADLRRDVSTLLDGWIEEGGPRFTEEMISDSMRDARGTSVAPFEISPIDRTIGVMVGRIVFSERLQGSRIRIASRDSFGDDYGVTITDNLKCFATGRGLGKYPRRAHRPVSIFVPGALENSLSLIEADANTSRFAATLTVGDDGLSIVVPRKHCPTTWSSSTDTLTAALSSHSAVMRGKPFTTLGLRVESIRRGIMIRPLGPEGTMRLTALQSRGDVLVVSDSATADGEPRGSEDVLIRLRPTPGDEDGIQISLNAIKTSHMAPISDCLRFFPAVVPDLPADLELLLAREICLHSEWVSWDRVETLI